MNSNSVRSSDRLIRPKQLPSYEDLACSDSSSVIACSAGAEAAFAQALDQDKAYFNIHTVNFGSGEIRGFLDVLDATPTMFCLGMGLIGLEMFRRKFGARPNA